MKKIFVFVVFISVIQLLHGQTVDDAIRFNDNIVLDQKKALLQEGHLINAIVDLRSTDTIQMELAVYTEYLGLLIEKYTGMKAFDSDDTFRKAIIELLTTLQTLATKEYAELVEIYTIPAEDLTDDHYSRWSDLTDIIDSRSKDANDLFLEKQKVFADKYGFTLTD